MNTLINQIIQSELKQEESNPLVQDTIRQKRGYLEKLMDIVDSGSNDIKTQANIQIYLDTLDVFNHRLNYLYSKNNIPQPTEISSLESKLKSNYPSNQNINNYLNNDYIKKLLLAYSNTITSFGGAGFQDIRYLMKNKDQVTDLNKIDIASFGGIIQSRINKVEDQNTFNLLNNFYKIDSMNVSLQEKLDRLSQLLSRSKGANVNYDIVKNTMERWAKRNKLDVESSLMQFVKDHKKR